MGHQKTSLKRKPKAGKTDARHDDIKESAVLARAIENTNEAFVTIDENHKVIFFNKAAVKIFGYSREEVIGHELEVIMSP